MVSNLRTGEKPAGRSYTVKVDHILQGAEYLSLTDGKVVDNPKVCWPGSGGYWSQVDINDILEANDK